MCSRSTALLYDEPGRAEAGQRDGNVITDRGVQGHAGSASGVHGINSMKIFFAGNTAPPEREREE